MYQPEEPPPIVTTIAHNGMAFTYTGKIGRRLRDGAKVYEFSSRDRPGYEFRLWAKADGTEIEED